jgi:YgiT-type zinc finger domain-containing protein
MPKMNKVLVCPICKSDDIIVKQGSQSVAERGTIKVKDVDVNVCVNCGHQWFKRVRPPVEVAKPVKKEEPKKVEPKKEEPKKVSFFGEKK